MSEKYNRVQLDETLEELVAGGELTWANNGLKPGYRVWIEGDKEHQYAVIGEAVDAKAFAYFQNGDKDDAGKIQALLENGYITPLF